MNEMHDHLARAIEAVHRESSRRPERMHSREASRGRRLSRRRRRSIED
jgi:hypothetical protein